ncbi:hypothetical protein [Rhodoferax sp. GW822-FHT02A01]|uniref:hypothetical protein n=1 Tax=Rhodoferax sp. GW822-FHT02A01 TaxID=3141537 RepID=UPI00315C4C4D
MADEVKTQSQQIAENSSELRRIRTPIEVKIDPRAGSVALAQAKVLQDINPIFAAVENVKVSGALLKAFTVDTTGNILRLDYEIDSLATAARVTEVLNAGNEQKPWKLGVVAASSGTGTPQVVGQPMGARVATAPVFRASWTVNLKVL